MKHIAIFLIIASLTTAGVAGESYQKLVGNITVGNVDASKSIQVPFITWGGDIPTFTANGGLKTDKNSIYGKMGLDLKLVPGDDPIQQVRDYISGKSPYLRMTVRMAGLASEVLNKDERTRPVMLFQLTFSEGDHLVGRKDIKTLNDLKGKKVVLQQGGPHLGLLEDSLKAANLTWNDIEVVWAKDLTASDNSPAVMFASDPSIAACCVITPDMIGLCTGIDQEGSGAEGTVEGAHVVNSTAQMSLSITDVYLVRSDYYKDHKEDALKFTAGYFKSCENLLAAKKAYNNGIGSSPEYVKALTLAQEIYSEDVLPTIEEDAHGLVSDARFVRIPGNESFFTDSSNLAGFDSKQKSAIDLAVTLGYAASRTGFKKPDIDYGKLSSLAGLSYTAPKKSGGRIRAEALTFDDEEINDNTIFSFNIYFEPEQSQFSTDTYGADFQRIAESAATFGKAAIIIRGHSDSTLVLRQWLITGMKNGSITRSGESKRKGGSGYTYSMGGRPLDLKNLPKIIDMIDNEDFSDANRTIQAARRLSLVRANAVKDSIEEYAKANNIKLDLSQIQPQGVGIKEAVVPKPTSAAEAAKNRRVEFRVIKVSSEALNEDDFDF